MAKLGVIDLCCGMGGLSLAAQQVGLDIWAGIDTSHDALRTFETNFTRALTINGDVFDPDVLQDALSVIEERGRGFKKFIIETLSITTN